VAERDELAEIMVRDDAGLGTLIRLFLRAADRPPAPTGIGGAGAPSRESRRLGRRMRRSEG
jgi:hypothetical protein